MPTQIYSQIKTAFKHLNPHEVRRLADRPLEIGILASGDEAYSEIVDTLLSSRITSARRFQVEPVLHRAGEGAADRYDLVLCDEDLLCPAGAFWFHHSAPQQTIREILDRREDLGLALARSFYPFRRPVVDRIVRTISKENAIFALATALPDIIPSFIELPWVVGEFASDTAFITMNQVRMAFLVAAASDHDVGYYEQRGQIAAVVGGAFGWRAIARELVGKIPLGGGLIPKAAIAYAGTYTVGMGLERFFRIGYGMTRAERREAYGDALERGKKLISSILESVRLERREA